MIAGEKWCWLVEDFWTEPAERNDLAVALRASRFEKTHSHFAGALLRVLRCTLSGLNLWRKRFDRTFEVQADLHAFAGRDSVI